MPPPRRQSLPAPHGPADGRLGYAQPRGDGGAAQPQVPDGPVAEEAPGLDAPRLFAGREDIGGRQVEELRGSAHELPKVIALSSQAVPPVLLLLGGLQHLVDEVALPQDPLIPLEAGTAPAQRPEARPASCTPDEPPTRQLGASAPRHPLSEKGPVPLPGDTHPPPERGQDGGGVLPGTGGPPHEATVPAPGVAIQGF